ncbi:snail family zinc finger 1a [Denticeps clupeoides]|uniref:C2H2-type domain-containing protein n=1 Tax=Denticeps clupeoides TaxID=299321 RepID=A0AAY4D0T1_9TELE|nr:protein snail homolog Sna-like [Denticeps clupeoides]
MPRSFLVKKYFASKRPNYSELECQNAAALETHPVVEVAPGDSGVTCFTAGLVWDVNLLPMSPSSGPLDLSSPSSLSSGSSSGDEDEGRTSDPPSPEPPETYRPQQRPRRGTKGRPAAREEQAEAPGAAVARPAFFCKHCPKEYTSLGALKMHIRSHTLPCVCPTCGKAFSRPWLLRGHIRTHTGERPFSCPHCNRAFADRSNLRAHLQTHADVKKYQCGTCSRTFSRMSLLQKHSVAGCNPPSV